jgi:hypothetical protein
VPFSFTYVSQKEDGTCPKIVTNRKRTLHPKMRSEIGATKVALVSKTKVKTSANSLMKARTSVDRM